MRAVLLDYDGTLNTLPDPAAFVQQLIDQGDYVVLYTDYEDVPEDLLALFNAVFAKRLHRNPSSTTCAQDPAVLEPIRVKDPTRLIGLLLGGADVCIDRIVVVDDELLVLESFARRVERFLALFDAEVTVLFATDINDLLNP
jgi:hypothetical protein